MKLSPSCLTQHRIRFHKSFWRLLLKNSIRHHSRLSWPCIIKNNKTRHSHRRNWKKVKWRSASDGFYISSKYSWICWAIAICSLLVSALPWPACLFEWITIGSSPKIVTSKFPVTRLSSLSISWISPANGCEERKSRNLLKYRRYPAKIVFIRVKQRRRESR